MEKFDSYIRLFAPTFKRETHSDEDLIKQLKITSEAACKQIYAAHQQTPFHIIHCHDWYSLQIGFTAAKKLGLPLILSLHSTEYERTQGYASHSLSSVICTIEKDGVEKADLIIVPHSSTRQQVITMYDADPEKVVIIPDTLEELDADGGVDASSVRDWLHIDRSSPVALFAGEMSHAAGADLLADALPQACGRHESVIFVFAGDGPLKGELEGRAHHHGIGHRCRFLGDINRETFDALLLTSDFVVIPARTWQDEGLAQAAIACGKPVLTTHQAGIGCVAHGQNGLVTYDNPGSIIWGVQEMLANPLQGSMLRLVARKKANEGVSVDNIIVQHYMYYEIVMKNASNEHVRL
jgi:glycosyltransferase involved in cell wall biosynthesis